MKLNVKWITGESKMGPEMIEWAKNLGEQLGREKLTTSQIRKFFGEVKRIQADWEKHNEDVPMLNAKLAYAVGREKKSNGIKTFADTFYDAIMKASEAKEYFDRLVKILEATVAYHKFYEDED